MTILPKNFGGAKKAHRKPTSSQVDHSKSHSKKTPVVERVDRSHQPQPRHLVPNPPNQEETPNSDDEYGQGFKDDEVFYRNNLRINLIKLHA